MGQGGGQNRNGGQGQYRTGLRAPDGAKQWQRITNWEIKRPPEKPLAEEVVPRLTEPGGVALVGEWPDKLKRWLPKTATGDVHTWRSTKEASH